MRKPKITKPNHLSPLSLFLIVILISFTSCTQPATKPSQMESPYIQDYAEKFEFSSAETTTNLLEVQSDRNKNIQILSNDGLLQPWKDKLVKEQQYRPLTDMNIISIASYKNQFVYLSDKEIFGNAWAGKFYVKHEMDNPEHFALGKDFSVIIAGKGKVAFFADSKLSMEQSIEDFEPMEILYDETKDQFLVLSKHSLYLYTPGEEKIMKVYDSNNLTSMAFIADNNQIIIGTEDGILTIDSKSHKEVSPLNQKLPDTNISCISEIDGKLWFGSSRGAFSLKDDGKYNYYASKRWLVDDKVLDISEGPDNSVLILTETGLSQIHFLEMTLAEKAEYFQEVQRLRHIRHGFSAETYLTTPGDLSTTVLHDTDNDGLWTSMYLAGELFRYGATKSEDALLNSYEAFEAMERLTEISGIKGFPARTYEIDSYQSSDNDPNMPEEEKIWRLTDDKRWRWKSTTSSDESCGHFFVYALFAELVPDQEWKDRAIHQIKIEMDHIIENDWYLVTWNGKPTEWGKWNPDYVNSFPITVGDRRLNSTLIISFLQTAYHFTGEEIYKEKAFELMDDYGYDVNASYPASIVGHVEGQYLSSTWNHSDDEMYFLTIPSFVKYAFNDTLKEKFFAAAKSHWELERSEKNPLWNYLYALSGGEDYDVEESIWWLKEFPMDLISWKVENAHRKDLTRIEPNFRRQEYTEVLPRDERPMHLHNNAYRNTLGGNGNTEYPPYIFLMPYWAGRYIEAMNSTE